MIRNESTELVILELEDFIEKKVEELNLLFIGSFICKAYKTEIGANETKCRTNKIEIKKL